MCLMDFSSKFVEQVDLLEMTNISFVSYLFHSCWLLLLNNLGGNFMVQKHPRKGDQETPDLFAIVYLIGKVESLI